MFRVQFGGSSREEMQEHCCSCVQKLSEYVPVQGAEEQSQQLCHGLSQDTQGMDTEHAVSDRTHPAPVSSDWESWTGQVPHSCETAHVKQELGKELCRVKTDQSHKV